MQDTFNPQAMQTINYSFNILRIKKDILFHEKEIERTKEKPVAVNDPFFQKLGKDIANTFNKQVNDANEKMLAQKREHLTNVITFARDNQITIIEDLGELVSYINEQFTNDIADLRSVYVAFNLIFSNPYIDTPLKESQKKESYADFSVAMGLSKTFFTEYEKDLIKKYNHISGKSQADLLSDALRLGTTTGAATIFLGSLVGVVAFATLASTLGGLILLGFTLGLFVAMGNYAYNHEKNKEEMLKAFRAMNPEEVDFMLLQKLSIFEALNKYRGQEEVDQMLQAMIDELINIKSDLDLALYGFRENTDNKNAKKKESFMRFDKYLLKSLSL
jgi:hypothetical protein